MCTCTWYHRTVNCSSMHVMFSTRSIVLREKESQCHPVNHRARLHRIDDTVLTTVLRLTLETPLTCVIKLCSMEKCVLPRNTVQVVCHTANASFDRPHIRGSLGLWSIISGTTDYRLLQLRALVTIDHYLVSHHYRNSLS